MILRELHQRITELLPEHADQEVYLDTGPNDLHTVGEVDIDTDGVGIIIWKE